MRARVGALIETPSFYPQLSAEKNLELSARLLGPEAMKTVPRVLFQAGLSREAGIKVRKFSTGMKQRLGIARALLGSPELLILDEPTNGLDPEGTAISWKILQEFSRDQGGTVLISSHLLYEIEEHCNRVCVIHEGQSVACGEVSRLLQPASRTVEVLCVNEAGADLLRRVAGEASWIRIMEREGPDPRRIRMVCLDRTPGDLHQFLVQHNIPLEQFTPLRQTLKDFFLSLTRTSENKTDKCEEP